MREVLPGNMYNGFKLINSWKNHQGYYKEILQWNQLLLEDMINRNPSVFFIRFDLRYPAGSALMYPDDNKLVSKFCETFMLYCKRHEFGPKYLWTRELSGTGQIHYHFMLLLNGKKIHYSKNLIRVYATEVWRNCLKIEDGNGLVHLCESDGNDRYYDDQHGGVMIRRKDPDFQYVYANCFQLASYLAKRYSKGEAPANTNEFGHSELERDRSI